MLLEIDQTKHSRKRENFFTGLIILFYFFHAFTASPLFVGYGYDREVFRYFGMLIYNGGIPYVDAFDHKPPVIYFLYFLGHIFDAGPWGAFIIFQIIGLSSSLALFAASKKHLGTNNSIIVTSFYIALCKYDLVINGGGLTRELTSSLVIILFSFCLLQFNNLRLFISGVLLSLIFYTQQNEIIAIIPLLIYFITSDLNSGAEDFRKVLVKRGVIFISGCLLIHFAIFFLFYSWNALDQFISQAFLFNTGHYIQENSFPIRFVKVIYNMTLGLEIYFPIFLAVILSCYPLAELLYKRNKIHSVYYFLFGCLLLQFISMALGKLQPHYFLGLIPYLVFIVFFFLKFYPETTIGLMSRERIAIGSVAIVIMLTVLKVYDYGHPRKRAVLINMRSSFMEELNKVRGIKGQLYSFDTPNLALNTDLNIVAPSKWVYQHFFMSPGLDDDNKLFKSVIQDIEKTKCTYIIVALHDRLTELNKKEL